MKKSLRRHRRGVFRAIRASPFWRCEETRVPLYKAIFASYNTQLRQEARDNFRRFVTDEYLAKLLGSGCNHVERAKKCTVWDMISARCFFPGVESDTGSDRMAVTDRESEPQAEAGDQKVKSEDDHAPAHDEEALHAIPEGWTLDEPAWTDEAHFCRLLYWTRHL